MMNSPQTDTPAPSPPHGPWVAALRQSAMIAAAALVLGLGVNALRPDGIALVGEWSAEARLVDETGRPMGIPLAEAERLFKDNAAVFVDARSAADYAAGHLEGAVSLPWQQVDDRFDAAAGQLEAHPVIITYCDGESCELSHRLADFLREMGCPDVRVLVNGWTRWKQAGLPVANGEK